MHSSNALRLSFGMLAALSSFACKASNPSIPQSVPAPIIEEPSTGSPEIVKVADAASAKMPEAVVARVGDESIYVSELLSTWMLVDGEGLRNMLGTLVTGHLVRNEAERLNIDVNDVEVSSELGRALTEMEEKLQAEQPGMNLDEWIASGLGLDPNRFRKGMRSDIESRLLAERVVRHYILSQPSADVSVIVSATEEDALAALARVRGGEPFARVATEVSVDPSGNRGGEIPPVVLNDSSLSRLAFGTAEGQVGGPLSEGGRWMILQTRKLNEPLVGPWSKVSSMIEASLLQRPIEEPEYWLWKSEMNKRHPADFEPFFELIGEPTAKASL